MDGGGGRIPCGGAIRGGGGIPLPPGGGPGCPGMKFGGRAMGGGGPRTGAGPRIGGPGIPGPPKPTPLAGPASPGGAWFITGVTCCALPIG